LAASSRKRGAATAEGEAEEAATPAGEDRVAGPCESDGRRDLDGLAKEEERATDPAVRVAIGSQSL